MSQNGIPDDLSPNSREYKRITFFNQTMTLGSLAIFLQIVSLWPLIGSDALYFLIIEGAVLISIYLNSKSKFKQAKIFCLFTLYIVGPFSTTLIGGESLYHLGAFSVFIFSLLVVDIKTEKWIVFFAVISCFLSVSNGEFGYMGNPHIPDSEMLRISRFSNLFSLFFINSLFITFIIKLNNKNEEVLVSVLTEKEMLLKELTSQSKELEKGKSELENTVKERTSEIESQKDELTVKNKEKEILLKEVHHRVKNNLQIIVSLLNLQMSKFDNVQIMEALEEAKSRVLSMSVVHKNMYQSNNFKEVGLKEHVDQLIGNIQQLYPKVNFDFDIQIPESVNLEVEQAIPTGLIINEIVVNFFKHGLTSDGNNKFTIELNEDDQYYHLRYHDQGAGFKKDLLVDDSSLGLHLIESLVEQLDGKFEYGNDEGAFYTFTIKKI